MSQLTINKTSRACPVCGGGSAHLVFQQVFEHFGEVGLLDGYDVVVCESCGMGFADRIPSQSALDDYYRDLSKYEYEHRGGKDSEDDEERLRDLADLIKNYVPHPGSRILEIGCATGKLLALLKGIGFRNVAGLDPSPRCAETARLLHGVEVMANTVLGLTGRRQEYDFLILIGVLEHIRDLESSLRNLYELLPMGGRVFVAVPDAEHLIVNGEAPFQEFSTEHIDFFTVTSLRNLMQVNGFGTVTCECTVRQYGIQSVSFVFGVFAKTERRESAITFDVSTLKGLTDYVRQCSNLDEGLRQRIAAAIGPQRRIIVWGVGTHTRRLLAARALNARDIVAFVDSNSKYQGQQLQGIPVISPEDLRDFNEPILISSCGFQDEIEQQIRKQLRLHNSLILLYERRGKEGC
jgi:2-polyprenyl-3-methyl-5-hydroxy-6-metoxy-1,4-benzoquinol methylase